MFAYFGVPGPLEILIILFILGLLAVPVVALVVILAVARKSGSSTPDSPPCPNCGSHVVPCKNSGAHELLAWCAPPTQTGRAAGPTCRRPLNRGKLGRRAVGR